MKRKHEKGGEGSEREKFILWLEEGIARVKLTDSGDVRRRVERELARIKAMTDDEFGGDLLRPATRGKRP